MKQRLPKYTLSYDDRRENWKLEQDTTNVVIKRFRTKEQATKGGVLKQSVGEAGGSVKIQKKRESRFQEERTYPRSRDPRGSRG